MTYLYIYIYIYIDMYILYMTFIFIALRKTLHVITYTISKEQPEQHE